MAIECLDQDHDSLWSSPPCGELTAMGFTYKQYDHLPGRGVHLIDRTDEQGQPFRL